MMKMSSNPLDNIVLFLGQLFFSDDVSRVFYTRQSITSVSQDVAYKKPWKLLFVLILELEDYFRYFGIICLLRKEALSSK